MFPNCEFNTDLFLTFFGDYRLAFDLEMIAVN